MHSYTNRLVNETSPYLLQHAHNPVDWYPWSDEAFKKATDENKPLLVSIGYSACHWCHVMERESFEDPEVASFMNEHFINIKVDREERPDVDHIYMDAVQAITGSGGWPLNVFVTPDGKPFYGGTYYPPKRAFNRASWLEVLQAIVRSYTEKKEEIDDQANNLTEHLKSANNIGKENEKFTFDKENIRTAFQNIMQTADKEWGGFGRAPKFPQTFTINFLLRYSSLTGNKEALDQAILSIDKMIYGGIYDQLAGGFARYSTDKEWLAPHFEKMLYDNALLVSTLSEAFQLTKKDRYKEVIDETLAFVEKTLMDEGGGFFSALDADSEEEEGKFYVWDFTEIENILGPDAPIFSDYYNLKKAGNWEGKNILHVSTSLEEFAANKQIELGELKRIVSNGKKILLEERNKRIAPSLDDKLLLSWNALMNSAYSKAYAATGNNHYKNIAIRNMNFLLNSFVKEENEFSHAWKNGVAKFPAFLDDYSFLIAALIDLSEISADTKWLFKGRDLTNYVLENFADADTSLFFYTGISQKDILIRKKEVYDSALPSGNSVMALNFHRLAILFDNEKYKQRAIQMLSSFGEMAIKYPTSFGVWLSALFEISFGSQEIAITGPEYLTFLKRVLNLYLPHRVLMSGTGETGFPLLEGKANNKQTLIYLCRNYACLQPLESVEEFENRISPNFLEKNTIFK